MENNKNRYHIMKGEMACNVAETNDLCDAKRITKELDSYLTADEWDNCDNHWILDAETDCSIDAYED